MEGNYQLQSIADSWDIIQLLEERIYEFNGAKINKTDGHLFSKVLHDDSGEVIAGVGGWTWSGACEVTQLWVDEKLRRKGIGTILLNAAEEEAVQKGCKVILIRTYSFQAPQFYMDRGYKSEHVLNDFPVNHTYLILSKKIQ